MAGKFEYLLDFVDIDKIKKIVELDEKVAKPLMLCYILDFAKGETYLPKYNSFLARELIKAGVKNDKVRELSKISKATFYRIKKEVV